LAWPRVSSQRYVENVELVQTESERERERERERGAFSVPEKKWNEIARNKRKMSKKFIARS